MNRAMHIQRPGGALRAYVSRLWLGPHNTDPVHTVLPDGAVDLVFEIGDADARVWTYGTTTCPTEVPLETGRHYLGVRFQPGQSRHFLAMAADELTDRRLAGVEHLRLAVQPLLDRRWPEEALIPLVEQALTDHLSRYPPESSRIDLAIATARALRGQARIPELAEGYGRSRRQFERAFLQATGLSPKQFSVIERFTHASELLATGTASLADIAAACGYADQSHMNRDFRRLAAGSPGRHRPSDVAIIQEYGAGPAAH